MIPQLLHPQQARQLSERGGELSVELAPADAISPADATADAISADAADPTGDRVILSGRTAFYMEGTIHLQAQADS